MSKILLQRVSILNVMRLDLWQCRLFTTNQTINYYKQNYNDFHLIESKLITFKGSSAYMLKYIYTDMLFGKGMGKILNPVSKLPTHDLDKYGSLFPHISAALQLSET
jgi:hypothetical protein